MSNTYEDKKIEFYIDNFCNHLSKDEKENTKKIRKLLLKIESIFDEVDDLNIILNTLELLNEFYKKKRKNETNF